MKKRRKICYLGQGKGEWKSLKKMEESARAKFEEMFYQHRKEFYESMKNVSSSKSQDVEQLNFQQAYALKALKYKCMKLEEEIRNLRGEGHNVQQVQKLEKSLAVVDKTMENQRKQISDIRVKHAKEIASFDNKLRENEVIIDINRSKCNQGGCLYCFS